MRDYRDEYEYGQGGYDFEPARRDPRLRSEVGPFSYHPDREIDEGPQMRGARPRQASPYSYDEGRDFERRWRDVRRQRPQENEYTDWYSGDWNWWEEGPYTGRGPANYQRSNERILEDVCERLTRHGQLDASGLAVSVADGVVTLSGTTSSRKERRQAEATAEGVTGVQDVRNEIEISPENE